jgi:hypothetical protein
MPSTLQSGGGAHDEHGQIGGQRALGLFAPGVVTDTGIVALLGGEVADGKDDLVDLQALAAGADDLEALSRGNNVSHLVGKEAEAGLADGFAHRAVKDGTEIEAVEAAGGEDAGGGVVQALLLMAGGDAARDPVLKMERLIGKGAHVGGADVEQVVVIVGGIGNAATECGGTLAKQDRLVRREAVQEVQRGDRAGEAGADYGNGVAR